jgi:putative transposase
METRTEGIESQVKGEMIQIDEKQVRSHLDQVVVSAVEETLNSLLEQEADRLCQASRYERNADRKGYRSGSYERKMQTKAGEVTLNMPKLRQVTFETAIIERYRRRESSVEEALIEMYLAGVSVRRVEDITEALWGTKVSPATISEMNKKLYLKLDEWLNKPVDGEYAYIYLDGIWMKRTWGGEVENVSVLVAVGVNQEGFREILGVAEGGREDKESWRAFLRQLKGRGLQGVLLCVSDCCLGLLEALHEFYPEAKWQRCVVHFYRNIFRLVPKGKVKEVAARLKAIHAQEDKKSAKEKASSVQQKLIELRLKEAADLLGKDIDDTLSYYDFPSEHWRSLRTNNMLERLNREIRRRTRVVGCFPDGRSAVMLVTARLRYVANSNWGQRRYLNMKRLWEQGAEATMEHAS